MCDDNNYFNYFIIMCVNVIYVYHRADRKIGIILFWL